MASRGFEIAFNLAAKMDNSFKQMTSGATERLQRVNKQIRSLGQDQQRIEKFQHLKRQLEDTRSEYESTQAEVKRLAQEIQASERPTKAQRDAFEQAKRKSRQLKQSLEKQGDQLQEVRNEMREAGQSTRNLAQQQQNLAKQTRLAQRRAEGWSRVANSNVAGSAQNAAANVGRLGRNASIAGAALTASAGYVVNNYAQGATETQRWADRLGLATSKLSELQHVGRQFGVRQGAIVDGLKEMSMRADEFAKTGSGPAAEAFQRLGLSESELNRVKGDTDALFKLISERMSGVQDTAARQRIADELMGGQAGEKMVEMLSASNKEIQRIRGQGRAVGNVISAEEGKQAERFTKALNNAQGALKGVQKTVVSELLPQITKALKSLSKWVANNQEKIQRFAETFSDKFSEALPKILQLTKGLATTVGKIGTLISKVASLVGGFRNLGIAIALAFSAKVLVSVAQLTGSLFSMGRGLVQVLASMNLVSGATKAWTAVQWALNAAMNANPLGLIVAGAAALAGAAYLVVRNWGKVKSFFTGLWDWLSNFDLFQIGKNIISTLLSGIKAMISKPAEMIKSAFSKVREYLPFSDAKRGPLSDLTSSGRSMMDTVSKGVQKAGPGLERAAKQELGRVAKAQASPSVSPSVGGMPSLQSGTGQGRGASGRGQVVINQTFRIDGATGEPAEEVRRAADEGADKARQAVENYFSEGMRLSYA